MIKHYTRKEFLEHIERKDFGPQPPERLVIHHTWRPTKEQWRGRKSMEGLLAFYRRKGWRAYPHLFIAEDGIWQMWDLAKDGIHAGRGNYRSIGIEVVGDYDRERWSGQTRRNALFVIRELCRRLDIPHSRVMFHRDYSPKTCPGKAISKNWLFRELLKSNEKTMKNTEKFRRSIEDLTGEDIGAKLNSNEMDRVADKLLAKFAKMKEKIRDWEAKTQALENEREKFSAELRSCRNELERQRRAERYLSESETEPQEPQQLVASKDIRRAGWTILNSVMAGAVSLLAYLATDRNVAAAAAILPFAQVLAQFLTKKLNRKQ